MAEKNNNQFNNKNKSSADELFNQLLNSKQSTGTPPTSPKTSGTSTPNPFNVGGNRTGNLFSTPKPPSATSTNATSPRTASSAPKTPPSSTNPFAGRAGGVVPPTSGSKAPNAPNSLGNIFGQPSVGGQKPPLNASMGSQRPPTSTGAGAKDSFLSRGTTPTPPTSSQPTPPSPLGRSGTASPFPWTIGGAGTGRTSSPTTPTSAVGSGLQSTGASFGGGGYAGAGGQPTLSAQERKDLLNSLNKNIKKSKDSKREELSRSPLTGGGLFSAGGFNKKPSSIDDIFKGGPTSKGGADASAGGIFNAQFKTQSAETDATPSAQRSLLDELAKLKEQQGGESLVGSESDILQRLKRLQGEQDEIDDEKKKKRKGIFWIFFLVLLIGIIAATAILIYFSGLWGKDDYEYIRISVSMTNSEQMFYETDVYGNRIPRMILPGNEYDLRIVASNSLTLEGDNESPNWEEIFVRFKIWLEIDGVKKDGFIDIAPNKNLWHTYSKDEEDSLLDINGLPYVRASDGFYYYKGKVIQNEQIVLIEKLRFSLDKIDEAVAGMTATIIVEVEVVEADLALITSRAFWGTAPQKWVDDLNAILIQR